MLFEEAGELPNRKDVELPADAPSQASDRCATGTATTRPSPRSTC